MVLKCSEERASKLGYRGRGARAGQQDFLEEEEPQAWAVMRMENTGCYLLRSIYSASGAVLSSLCMEVIR